MIKDMWKLTKLNCGNGHEELIPMTLEQKGKELVYKCSQCKNYITARDFEKIINRISKMVYDAEMNNEMANFTGYKWTEKGLKVNIIEDNEKGFIITAKNRDDLID